MSTASRRNRHRLPHPPPDRPVRQGRDRAQTPVRIPRPAGGPGPRRTVCRDEHPGGEGDELLAVRQAAAGRAAARAAVADAGPVARRRRA